MGGADEAPPAAAPAQPEAADPKIAAIDKLLYQQSSANSRSIPEALFIENVEGACREHEQTAISQRLQELYSKYQYMQSSLIAHRSGLKTKLPDISSALETVQHLIDRRDKAQEGEADAAEYTYQLCENIYAKASVPPTDNVCLWLGANCMLEYTLDEAIELLRNNEANAKTTLKSVEEDMAFLRDQMTTTEVNIARAHNFGVKERQKVKDQAAATSATASSNFSPAPRGGEGPGYTWKQDTGEVEIHVTVPEGAQKADVKVAILAESVKVEHAGKVLLEGQLAGKCRPDGSTWTMTANRVEVTLEKADSATPWQTLFE